MTTGAGLDKAGGMGGGGVRVVAAGMVPTGASSSGRVVWRCLSSGSGTEVDRSTPLVGDVYGVSETSTTID